MAWLGSLSSNQGSKEKGSKQNQGSHNALQAVVKKCGKLEIDEAETSVRCQRMRVQTV